MVRRFFCEKIIIKKKRKSDKFQNLYTKIYKERVRSYWTFVIFGDIMWIHMKKLYFQCKFQGGTKNGKKNEDHGW